ncbi:MAG TPA: hypothetical protein VKW76_01755 [Candidatus Binatia bacterium]|nr:hypothetical protein [Candidatus Binatia bacterium]
MIDALLLLAVLLAATAAGFAVLRALDGLPPAPADRLLAAAAAGLGVAGAVGLGLAAGGVLRPLPLAAVGIVALALGGGDVVRGVRAALAERRGWSWAVLAPCALVLAAEAVTMLAPPVGGDQTKYQLVYPRLYARAGGLVETPWSFWGQMQYLQNFDFAIAFALRGDVLARFVNGAFGVLATLGLAALARRHLARGAGRVVALVFFTLPITWSLMTRAGSDFPVVLYAALGVSALLDWRASGAAGDLRRAALMAGLAGGSKVMGLLVPALLGLGMLIVLARRPRPPARALAAALVFGVVALVSACPWYVRNAVDTGNPIYPFGYRVFGGRWWSAAASDYLADYYRAYQTTWAERRAGTPYAGLAVLRFPWDLTMHPESFEKGARQSLDVGPVVLAFVPALGLVRRRRRAVFAVAAFGAAYVGIIAGAAWAHPRYVLPGIALLLVSAVPAAAALAGRRLFALVVALTVAGNLAVTSKLLRPLWPDQVRVAFGRMRPTEFLRRHSDEWVFWERANAVVPPGGRVLVLEKIPHPYYIERPFVLASYLEQGLLDYRTLETPVAFAGAARLLGVTHVAVDVAGLEAEGDPFEARVTALWRRFLSEECEPALRAGGFGLYVLRTPTALAAAGEGARG